jgi:hypothetical protein
VKVSEAFSQLKTMNPTGVLLVKGRDGAWTAVEAVTCTGVDAIYPPTTMLLEGVRYVREDAVRKPVAVS